MATNTKERCDQIMVARIMSRQANFNNIEPERVNWFEPFAESVSI